MSAHPSIVFVHGMHMNGLSWDPWVQRAKTRGFESTAPSCPFHEGNPAESTHSDRPFDWWSCRAKLINEGCDAAFDNHVVQKSRNAPRSTLTKQGYVDFSAKHVPLLVLAGDSDHLVPQALIEKNAKAYISTGVLDFTTFTQRSHFICNQEGWEEVADFAFDGAVKHVARTR